MNVDEYCASEDLKVMNCDPCQFEEVQKEARAFCYDCREYLCQQCLHFHRKFQAFRNHHILQGDSMPRTKEEIKVKLELTLCDNHRINEVQFYCKHHKTVFCSLCKVAKHQNCDCTLITEMTSTHEDKNKFDNILKNIKVIRNEFEHLKAEKIEIIDETSASFRIQKELLEALRNEINALFAKKEEEQAQERLYITELREGVAMYSDVINELASLTEQADQVSKSNDQVAIFAATCKLTQVHEDFAMLKENITLKTMVKKTNTAQHELLKLKDLWDIMKKETEPNKLQKTTDKQAGQMIIKEPDGLKAMDKQVGLKAMDKKGVHKTMDKQVGNTNSKATDKVNKKEQNINKENKSIEKSSNVKQENMDSNNSSKDLLQKKTDDENALQAKSALPEQKPLNDEIKEDKLNQENAKEAKSNSGQLKAKKITTINPEKKELLFENLNFTIFLYKYINTAESHSLCDITGSLFLHDGSLILCDHSNSYVLLFDKEFNLVDQQKFDGKVWDVALANANEVIVSLTHQKMLIFLKVNSGKLQRINKINLKRVPWGISVYKEHILISYHNNPGNGVIEVRSKRGKVLRDITVDEKGEHLFEAPYYIDVNQNTGDIYVTDSRKNRITCLSLEGNVLYKIEGENIMWPKKIILDDQGNCLLCANFANKVMLIKNKSESSLLTKDTDEIKVLLKACTRPQTVSVRRDDLTTIIGLNSSNMILVLKS